MVDTKTGKIQQTALYKGEWSDRNFWGSGRDWWYAGPTIHHTDWHPNSTLATVFSPKDLNEFMVGLTKRGDAPGHGWKEVMKRES